VNDPRAAVAAYGLGRIAFDQEHAYAQAARWFAAYLNEQPVGPLAREASGRLMEAKQRSGDLAGARSSAQRYLREYPDGPQAALAQELLGQAGSSQPAR
jgi:outer membrane protein assembly factor BamD (BamD/ComL family)